MTKAQKMQTSGWFFPPPKNLLFPAPVEFGYIWSRSKCSQVVFGSIYLDSSVFVRRIIWHRAEGYNCYTMSQILSFLTHVTDLPVGLYLPHTAKLAPSAGIIS